MFLTGKTDSEMFPFSPRLIGWQDVVEMEWGLTKFDSRLSELGRDFKVIYTVETQTRVVNQLGMSQR